MKDEEIRDTGCGIRDARYETPETFNIRHPTSNTQPSTSPVLHNAENTPLVLGSASPRRRKILEQMTREFTVMTAEVEEIHDAADPVRTVTHNALAKYEACRKLAPDAAIITADTLVWFEGELIGKPENLEEAAEFLGAFSGSSQIVFSGIAMGMPGGRSPDVRVEASSVHFKELSEQEIQEYLMRTKPLDRAGAYDIDENGELLIEGYSGSYTNIMGMPAGVIREWLTARGFSLVCANNGAPQ